MLDATRAVENAYFIQQREPGYQSQARGRNPQGVLLLSDGCTMSGKKDALVNIGGWLAMNDQDLFEEAAQPGGRLRGLAHLRRPGGARHGSHGARHRRMRSRTITSAPASARSNISANT